MPGTKIVGDTSHLDLYGNVHEAGGAIEGPSRGPSSRLDKRATRVALARTAAAELRLDRLEASLVAARAAALGRLLVRYLDGGTVPR